MKRRPYSWVTAPEPLLVGVIGGGFIAQAHTDAYRACGAKIISCCDQDLGRAREVVAKDGGRVYKYPAKYIESEAEMNRTARPDLIVIALPNDLHARFASQAIAAGIPVDLEKPVTTSLQDAQIIRLAAFNHSIPIGVPSVYRFDFLAGFAGWMVQNGYIGSVRSVSVDYLQGWGLGGRGWRGMCAHNGPAGVMGDVGATHAYDLCRKIGGVSLELLRCDLRYDLKVKGEETDDTMLITGIGTGGTDVRLQATQTRHGNFSNTRRFEIAGSRGTLIFDSRKSKVLEWGRGGSSELLPDDPGVLQKRFPKSAGFLSDVLLARPGGDHFDADFGESWKRYAHHFLADVRRFQRQQFDRNAPTPYANIDDGVAQVALIEAALRSFMSGSKQVAV